MKKITFSILLAIALLASAASPATAENNYASTNIYITNYNNNSVTVLDTTTNTVTDAITVGTNPSAITFNADGSIAYVANYWARTVSVINTSSNSVITSFSVGGRPMGIAIKPSGDALYTSDYLDGFIRVYPTSTYAVDGGAATGSNPEDICINPAGTLIYSANNGGNSVSVFNAQTYSIVSTITVGTSPSGIAINPEGSKVYVTNSVSGTVSVIDTATNTVTNSIIVGTNPKRIKITSDGSTAYVTNHGSGTVSVIDLSTETVTDTITVGTNPWGVAVNHFGTMVYVSNYGSNTVSVIDTSTNTVTDTISGFNSPADVEICEKTYLMSLASNFTANVTAKEIPFTVQFTDTTTGGTPTSYLWNFGDGSTSTEQNPVHTYTSGGYYQVSLSIANATEWDTESKSNYIHAIAPYATLSGTALTFYDGEINDPSYLTSHITGVSDPTYIFNPYGNGYKFYNFTTLDLSSTGKYNFSNKYTYVDGLSTVQSAHSNFKNCTIQGNNTYPNFASVVLDSDIIDSKFEHIGQLQGQSSSTKWNMSNVTFINSGGIHNYEGSNTNGTIHDLTFDYSQDAEFAYFNNFQNCNIYNVTAQGVTIGNDGCTGFVLAAGNNNTVRNVTLNCTGRSGFDITYFEHDFYCEDIEVNASGHNGLDMHGGYRVTMKNLTVRDSICENFMITSPNGDASVPYIHNRTGHTDTTESYTVPHDFYVSNLYSENATGSDLSWNRYIDVYAENITSERSPSFGIINYGENLTIVNATCKNMTGNAVLTIGSNIAEEAYCNDTKLVDCSFTGDGSHYPYISVFRSKNNSFINVYTQTPTSMRNDMPINEYTNYYYPNLIVVNTTGQPVKNAVVTVNTTARNGYGAVQTQFLTDSNGKLYDSGNRSNWIAVPDQKTEVVSGAPAYTYYTPQITVSKSGQTNSTVVDPASSWYSADPSNLKGTAITLTLNVGAVSPLPDADFSANVTSGNASLSIAFTDKSAGVPTKWNWNFGDGTVNSAAQNPTHTYETAGIYTVTLTITDVNGNTDSNNCVVTVLEKAEDVVETKSIIEISPSLENITPRETFAVNISVNPSTPISGTQLDFLFNSLKASANNVTEGDFLKQNGAYTIFSGGTISNNAGTVKNIYGSILGTSNVSSPGTVATVNLTAGNRTGIAEFSLSNVLISDANSESVPYTVKNATVLIDTAPVMNASCCQSVDEENTLTFKVSAKDADGDKLTLSASRLPNGASFDPATGVFTWTPLKGQTGFYTVTLKVSDGYLEDSEDVGITVNTPNNAPSITSFEPENGSVFNEGDNITIALKASDTDGQALSYVIKIDGTVYSTSPSYIWNTNYSSSGSHTLELTVSDGIEEVKKVNTIYINDVYPRWDVNNDGVVNIRDVTMVSRKYGTITKTPYPNWDVNQDGIIDTKDLDIVKSHFGEKVE